MQRQLFLYILPREVRMAILIIIEESALFVYISVFKLAEYLNRENASLLGCIREQAL